MGLRSDSPHCRLSTVTNPLLGSTTHCSGPAVPPQLVDYNCCLLVPLAPLPVAVCAFRSSVLQLAPGCTVHLVFSFREGRLGSEEEEKKPYVGFGGWDSDRQRQGQGELVLHAPLKQHANRSCGNQEASAAAPDRVQGQASCCRLPSKVILDRHCGHEQGGGVLLQVRIGDHKPLYMYTSYSGTMHPVVTLSLAIVERHAISCLHMIKAIGSNIIELKHLRNAVLLS